MCSYSSSLGIDESFLRVFFDGFMRASKQMHESVLRASLELHRSFLESFYDSSIRALRTLLNIVLMGRL